MAVALVAVARHLLLGYLTPQNVINRISLALACRAQIDSIDAHLIGRTRIEIKRLAHKSPTPRRSASRRTPRPASAELAELKNASAARCQPFRRVHRRLSISRLTTEPTIHTRVQRGRHINLEHLFDPLIREVEGSTCPAAPDEIITTCHPRITQ
ncbi:MAG: hypothetical protein R3F31_07850 [Verrucomicrobiales bacterium]